MLLTSDQLSRLTVWDYDARTPLHVFDGHAAHVLELVPLPLLEEPPMGWSSHLLCSASLDGTLRMWDMGAATKELRVMRGAPTPCDLFGVIGNFSIAHVWRS